MAVSHEEIDAWIEARREELLGCASRIVKIPSESTPPTGEELECQSLIEALLEESGADEVDWFTPDDVPGLRAHPAFFPMVAGMERQFAGRPDVVGTFRGTGGGRSILFSTHVDTVVAGADPWQVAGPFSGAIVDGKLYGRGACDTKAAMASYIYAVRCLRALGARLRGDVKIESTCDEEWGGSHGVLAARLRGHGADVAINTEPTGLAVCPEHRGGRDMYVVTRGTAQFLGEGQSANSIGTLARTVLAIEEFERQRNARTPTPPLYRDHPGLPVYLDQVRGGGTTYSEAMGPPPECSLHVWAETYAGTTAEEFDRELMAAITAHLRADHTFHGELPELQPTIRYLPGSAIDQDHPIFAAMEEAYRTLPGREYRRQGAPLACDAYIFNLYSSTPALVWGPGGGNIHAADEYVLVDDLIDLARLTARLLVAWCGTEA